MKNKLMLALFTMFTLFTVSLASAQQIGEGVSDSIKPLLQMGVWGIVIMVAFFIILIIGGVIGWVQYQKKKWYLLVPLKMPRDGGKTINAEIAKGYWDSRKATLWVKRKGMFGAKFFVEIDDIRKYLQGNETIELLGSGVSWKPILPESYITVIDSDTGQEANIMKYSMDFTRDKAWAIRAEREYTNTFSLSDTFNKLKDYIGWGIVIGIVILSEVVRIAYVGG